MSSPMPAQAILDREFLEIRAKILEIAASFDRCDRGDGDIRQTEKYQLLMQGIDILQEPEDGRAERVQEKFSLQYDSDWRSKFGLD